MTHRTPRAATALTILGLLAFAGTATAGHEPPELRLGETVRPTGYRLELILDPDAETFPGRVVIDLELEEATSVLWLHGKKLEISEARLTAGGAERALEILDGGEEFVGFELAEPVGPGAATLEVAYQGRLPESEVGGLFRRRQGGEWYIFSQFQAISARLVFPSFDEPSFKVPFQLTLTVPEKLLAFSNTPVETESAAEGMKTLRFRRTRPLPSYLLAIAVGPFEVVDAGRYGGKETQVRIITPRGRAAEATWAVESTGPILELLEGYFGTPYPYEKLDQIAVLNFGGAMENPGLITYGNNIILSKPEEDTVPWRRGYASICAHELAHMWFGDLVTMEWWDDTWLNESFATWMADKIVRQWQPDWNFDVRVVRRRGRAMQADSLDAARKMRQPIESSHDIANAFDGITYAKGASVLAMFEAWVGEEAMRKGVRQFLARHADGNATGEDFLAALEGAAGEGVSKAFASFLDQNGMPIVSARLDCEGEGPPRLELGQKRYLPTGSAASAERTWRVPVCVEYGAGDTVGRDCVLLTEPSSAMTLTSAESCPDWVLPNGEMAGYYRVDYGDDLLEGLFEASGDHLSLAERVGVIDDLRAQVLAGLLPYGEALARLPGMLEDRNRHIVRATVSIVDDVADDLVPEGKEAEFARFVRAMYGEQARQLGWAVAPGDDDDTRLLRDILVPLVAGEGEDPDLVAQAKVLTGKWLEDRSAVGADMVSDLLGVAARHGDEALWKKLYEQAKAAGDEKERGWLLNAMGSFADSGLVERNLEIALSDEFPIFEVFGLIFGALDEPTTRDMAFEHVKENFDEWVARLPEAYAGAITQTAGFFCDQAAAQDAEAFFRPRVEDLNGGPRALAQTLEAIRLCAAKRGAHLASVKEFLEAY